MAFDKLFRFSRWIHWFPSQPYERRKSIAVDENGNRIIAISVCHTYRNLVTNITSHNANGVTDHDLHL